MKQPENKIASYMKYDVTYKSLDQSNIFAVVQRKPIVQMLVKAFHIIPWPHNSLEHELSTDNLPSYCMPQGSACFVLFLPQRVWLEIHSQNLEVQWSKSKMRLIIIANSQIPNAQKLSGTWHVILILLLCPINTFALLALHFVLNVPSVLCECLVHFDSLGNPSWDHVRKANYYNVNK